MAASVTAQALAARLSDRDLLDATVRAAANERRTTARLLVLIGELDSRRLYLGEGCSSLFTYCTQVLHLSDPAAYTRITAARAARRFPSVLARLAEGELTLTSISLLAAHLTDENQETLVDAARHAGKRDVERLVASLCAQPDIPASVRRLPAPETLQASSPALSPPILAAAALADSSRPTDAPSPSPTVSPRHAPVAPLAADRYLLRVTLNADTHAKLGRARDLLRHTFPSGDLVLVLNRALEVLIDHLERRKTGRLSGRARTSRRAAQPRGRHIPAAVRREVWARDEGRCAFVGPQGRCQATGFLEYHHVVPFARGGPSDAANLELRCRAHNQYEAREAIRTE